MVKGHGRLDAARLLEMEAVPVDYQDYEHEAAEWADMVADNRIAELADTDQDALKELLAELEGEIDMDLTGFDGDAIADLLRGIETEEAAGEVPEPPANPITLPGNLYELGEHRLLCGDATNPEDLIRLMQGERAILFATDPPYLVGYDGCNHPNPDPKANKDWSDTYGKTWDEQEENSDLYDRFIAPAKAHAIAPNAAWYCWHASRRQKLLEEAWEKHGALVHQQIIWLKNTPILTRSWYFWNHEPCFFGWLKRQKPEKTAEGHLNSVWEISNIVHTERPDHPPRSRLSASPSRCASTPAAATSATSPSAAPAPSSSQPNNLAAASTAWKSRPPTATSS